jgi:hypothetical protein
MGERFMPAVSHRFGRKPRRFSLIANLDGASNPTLGFYPRSLAAAGFARAEHVAAGKYEFEMSDVWPVAITEVGSTYLSVVENVDMYTQTQVTLSALGRIIVTVRLKTGAVNTDPAGAPNGGSLLLWIELETAP